MDSANRESAVQLRDDVRLLGDLLGETLIAQVGEELYQKVENLRMAAKAVHTDGYDRETVSDLIADLTPDEILAVARAFTQFLNLANIAEQAHGVRSDEAEGGDGILGDYLTGLLARDVDADTLYRTVCDLNIELVMTAHPTEVKRRTLIQKDSTIANLLAKLDRARKEGGSTDSARQGLHREITAIWLTDEIRRRKPTPVEEAKWGFAVVESILWQAVPKYLRNLDTQLQTLTGRPLPADASPIRFGAWMGGDRDGNPNVVHETTQEVCLLARWMAADLYWRDVDALRSDLSLRDCSEVLRGRVGSHPEPYRELLREVREHLAATRTWIEARLDGVVYDGVEPYHRQADLLAPLQLCYDSLHEVGAGMVADGPLLDLIRRVNCFGMTLMRLDIRQESTRHTEAVDAITRYLGLGSYAEWDEASRQAFLLTELNSRRPLIPKGLQASEEVQEVLATFTMLAEQNAESLGSYVISMATEPSDVLAVALLQKEAGIHPMLPIAPLFETLDDLEQAGRSIDKLLAMPGYRALIGNFQEVMIGYSDSAKDAGLLMASWAQYQAQEQLTEICARHGVRLRLFHGRGGSVGRGGAPAHAAIRSQPPGSINGGMRVTEQGEMIRAKFGLPGLAMRTLESYITANLEAILKPSPAPEDGWREMMQQLADTSVAVYRKVVREEPQFVPYFRSATPELELGELAIGSRPARRRRDGGIESLRAIPWIFAWTQNRLILPAWLGVGDAMTEALEADQATALCEMRAGWPFFATILSLIEMVLAKADPDISACYEARLVDDELKPLGEALRRHYLDMRQAVLQVIGHEAPLADNPQLCRSVEVRNPYADALNLMQIELLRQVRAAGEEADQTLKDALLVTISGIAAGMRNTG